MLSDGPCVPGYGADGGVGGGRRLVHEELQVDAALVSGHGHDGVRLPLVALVEQLGDKPGVKVRLLTEDARTPCGSPPLSQGGWAPSTPPRTPPSLRAALSACRGSPITGHYLPKLHGAQRRTRASPRGSGLLSASTCGPCRVCVSAWTPRWQGAHHSQKQPVLLADPVAFLRETWSSSTIFKV